MNNRRNYDRSKIVKDKNKKLQNDKVIELDIVLWTIGRYRLESDCKSMAQATFNYAL